METKWYVQRPPPVQEDEDVTFLWDSIIHIDGIILTNRPDIETKTKKTFDEHKCYHTNLIIPSDRNISAKELEKYKILEIEITRMWHLSMITIPVGIRMLTHQKQPPQPPREIQGWYRDWRTGKLDDEWTPSKLQHFWNRPEYKEESCWLHGLVWFLCLMAYQYSWVI